MDTEVEVVPPKRQITNGGSLYNDEGAEHVARAVRKAWSRLSEAIWDIGHHILELTRAVENVGR